MNLSLITMISKINGGKMKTRLQKMELMMMATEKELKNQLLSKQSSSL
jgi:hypothetical protein